MRWLAIMSIVLAFFTGSAFAQAPPEAEVEAIKTAFIKYTQALMDHDLTAAKGASTGNELAQKYLELDVERQMLSGKLMEAANRFKPPATRPTSRSVPDAASLWGSMLAKAIIKIDGDTATITARNAPFRFTLKKVDGVWKADAGHWQRPVTAQRLAELEKMIPIVQDILAKVDSGEINSAAQFDAAMKEAERIIHGDSSRATTQPTTQPAR